MLLLPSLLFAKFYKFYPHPDVGDENAEKIEESRENINECEIVGGDSAELEFIDHAVIFCTNILGLFE